MTAKEPVQAGAQMDGSAAQDTVPGLSSSGNKEASESGAGTGSKTSSVGALQATPTATGCTECQVIVQTLPAGLNLVSIAPTIVSATLVVIGWYVVYKTQGNRERRKQIREYLAVLTKDLADLESLVIGYHTKERDQLNEQAIISKLSRFERGCETLPRFLLGQKIFRAIESESLKIDTFLIQQLRKSMTLRHFADEHLEKLSYRDEVIQEIELAATNLQAALEVVRIAALD